MAYYLYDLVSLAVISAVISVVFNLAKNRLERPLAVEIVRTFAMLVLGITGCGLLLVALSPWI